MSTILIIKRSDLMAARACPDGLALYDALKAEQDSARRAQGRPVRPYIRINWTPLGMVWFSCQHPSFFGWMRDNGLVPVFSLRGADLGGANLYGADLRGANLGGADLHYANLRDANLRGANLSGADLCSADLRGAYLRGADLGGADLGGANLYGANLGGAYLRGADLRGANLGGADLGGADLRGANLGGAAQVGANLGSYERGPDGYARIKST